MTSRVWLFEDMCSLPSWKAFERVKNALWVVSDTEPQVYHGFVELDSPQKVTYCRKIINATWRKCDKVKKAEYINTPRHHVYKKVNSTNSNKVINYDDMLTVIKEMQNEIIIINKQLADLRETFASWEQQLPSKIENNINNTTKNNTITIIQTIQ